MARECFKKNSIRSFAELFGHLRSYETFCGSSSPHHTRFCLLRMSSQNIPADDSNDKSFDFSYAGIVRSISSSLVRNLPKIGKGKFTRIFRTGLKLKPRTVAHSTDRLKELVEFREHYFSAGEHGSGGGHEAPSSEQMTKRQVLTKVILPAFVRHVIFATIVFSTYENVYDDYFVTAYPNGGLIGPFLCGGISGALGGTFHATWDLVSAWRNHAFSTFSWKGASSMTMAHSAAQASLFGSYEIFRSFIYSQSLHANITRQVNKLSLPEFISLDSTATGHGHGGDHDHHGETSVTKVRTNVSKDDSSFVADIVCISLAGGLAGMVCEMVQHSVKIYDLQRVASYRQEITQIMGSAQGIEKVRAWARLFLPGGKHLFNSALPMCLAFMAYEYGKGKAFHHHTE